MNSSVFARYLAEEEGGLPVGAIIGIIAAVLLAVLVVVYLILARKYSERITYKREFSEKGSYEGDELFLIETIANRSFLPFFFHSRNRDAPTARRMTLISQPLALMMFRTAAESMLREV